MVITDEIGVAQLALRQYDIGTEATLRLLNLSENATYLVDDAGAQSILRVHRQNYHRPHEIESELDWLQALQTDSDVEVPVVLPARDGRRVVTVDGAETGGIPRYVVHFGMVEGAEPDEERLTVADFHTLGRITAALHDHSRRWQRPATFARFSWDWEHSLGANPRWGRWQDAEGVGASETQLLGRAQDLLHQRLRAYGTGPEVYGLIHADLRLANLLVDSGASGPSGSPGPSRVTVIDFDDCGSGWYFYDFGTAVSFIEDDPALPEWQDAWVNGYRTRADLPSSDEDMLASFVLMRRLLLLAWMGTHSHSKESATKAISYAAGSCDLAERYLRTDGLSLT